MSKDKPLYEQAFAEYSQGLKYKEIAAKYGVTVNTVKSWKTRHWNKMKSMHTKEKSMHTKKNLGGAPKGNENAVKHGLFERYLPPDILDIVNQLQEKKPIDILWDQIVLAYAAIIRSQKIMYVNNDIDHTKLTSGDFDNGSTYQIETAQIKQGNYLNSLSRVQSQLNNMIKQYEKMLNEDPLATEEQKARIENIKARTEKLRGDNLEIEDTEELDNDIFG